MLPSFVPVSCFEDDYLAQSNVLIKRDSRWREIYEVLAARMRKFITARARKNKRTARMLANARKDHSIPLHITSCLMVVYKHTSSGYRTSIGKHYCEFTRYTLRNILTRATKTWRIYDSKRNSQDVHSSCDFIRGKLKRSHSFGCLWRLVRKVITREFASIFSLTFDRKVNLNRLPLMT